MLDSGNRRKLEQFGPHVLIRPEPAAYWPPRLSDEKWQQLASARFVPYPGKQSGLNRGGKWEMKKSLPDSWPVDFDIDGVQLRFLVSPSPFGHVALFPEQHENWKFIASRVRQMPEPDPKVLNIFAYTGAASVVARSAGAEVYHVDSSRPVLNQARQNMELNNLSDIRWVYEDAFKFVRREAKRGNRYSGIIMDPPPSGRGPSGERWKLSEQLNHLLGLCNQILEPQNAFLVFSFYAIDWSHEEVKRVVSDKIRARKIVSGHCRVNSNPETHDLELGSFVRLSR